MNAEGTPGDGFRGIWYNIDTKYSGGFATYPQQHMPIAIYRADANKTFFCYGGVQKKGGSLLHMVSYFDHRTGKLARPTLLLDKKTTDAHDNPTLCIDGAGYIYVFSNSHGNSRTSYIHKSERPLDITSFRKVFEGVFSYGQPRYLTGAGFLFLHTRYAKGRELHWMTSADASTWSEPKKLAGFGGHYQISWTEGSRTGTAFDYHPSTVDARTNLYYAETTDAGANWHTASGLRLETPLTDKANPALVRDYQSEGKLVYLKDISFDSGGHPVILYLTSKGFRPGPESGVRNWWTARWDGSSWLFRRAFTSDHNYDHGSLYIEKDGLWRVIAPTDPGPQPQFTGGEMVLWESSDQGLSWKRARTLTSGSTGNHTYARRPLNAHPDFYCLWADGDSSKPSDSSLYFCNWRGDVYRMPEQVTSDFADPIPLAKALAAGAGAEIRP